ncbi:MAG TPA: GntR family transcriptional regulator, partial [Rhizobacter sp.]|nr:GntR family transcriptional regulator [Rhizobacter sp.]
MDTPVDAGFPLYHRVAGELAQAIQGGSLRTGDRLPSVRQLCQQHGVSASTITLA